MAKLKTYTVTVTRSVVEEQEFCIEARSIEEAKTEALDRALDALWSPETEEAEYTVQEIRKA